MTKPPVQPDGIPQPRPTYEQWEPLPDPRLQQQQQQPIIATAMHEPEEESELSAWVNGQIPIPGWLIIVTILIWPVGVGLIVYAHVCLKDKLVFNRMLQTKRRRMI